MPASSFFNLCVGLEAVFSLNAGSGSDGGFADISRSLSVKNLCSVFGRHEGWAGTFGVAFGSAATQFSLMRMACLLGN